MLENNLIISYKKVTLNLMQKTDCVTERSSCSDRSVVPDTIILCQCVNCRNHEPNIKEAIVDQSLISFIHKYKTCKKKHKCSVSVKSFIDRMFQIGLV